MRRVRPAKKHSNIKIYLPIGGLLIAGVLAFYYSNERLIIGKKINDFWETTTEFVTTAKDAITGRNSFVLSDESDKNPIISGHARTTRETIQNTLGLLPGKPIMDIDLAEAKTNLEKLPWIKSAIIERHFPNKIKITLQEKDMIALWQHNGKYLPLDADGIPIQDPNAKMEDPLLIVGENAPRHAPALVKIFIDHPIVGNLVKSAVWRSNRRWDLYLNDAQNGVRIELPEENILGALTRLEKAITEEKILKRDLKKIDLRQPDRILVQTREVSGK